MFVSGRAVACGCVAPETAISQMSLIAQAYRLDRLAVPSLRLVASAPRDKERSW